MEKFNLRYLKPSAFIFICVMLGLSVLVANQFINNHWGVSISVFAVVGGVFGFINSQLWNIRPFSWMYSVPDFSGRYEGVLRYEYMNDKGETISDTLPHIKVIVQNGSDVVVNSWTKKKDGEMSSKSVSIDATIEKKRDGTFTLIYNYLNDGNSPLGFSPHYGTEVMTIVENGDGRHLIGKYYTERQPYQTKGKIDLKYVSKDLTHEIL
ncbi:MAG: hypothetical protein WAZ98_08760 [Cyclobacteriaceae bacterium]